jgi:hypothetical protein
MWQTDQVGVVSNWMLWAQNTGHVLSGVLMVHRTTGGFMSFSEPVDGICNPCHNDVSVQLIRFFHVCNLKKLMVPMTFIVMKFTFFTRSFCHSYTVFLFLHVRENPLHFHHKIWEASIKTRLYTSHVLMWWFVLSLDSLH